MLSDYDYAPASEITILAENEGYKHIEVKGRPFIDVRDLNHSSIRDYLRRYLSSEIDSETVEDFAGRYPLSFLINYIPLLERMEHRDTRHLIKILKEEKQKRTESYSIREKKGTVEMGDVETVFPVGTQIVFAGHDGLVGGIVKSIKIQSSYWSGIYFEIKLAVIHAVKGEVQNGHYIVRMPGFFGVVPLNTLPLRCPTPADKKILTARGKKFEKFWKPGTYVSYKGPLVQPSYYSQRTFRADGRVVIDPVSFERNSPDQWRDCARMCGVNINEDDERTSTLVTTADIDPSDYWRCLPQLYGFSLAVKQWGRLDLDGMTEIEWRDNAWETLVVDEEEKDLIYSLVKFHGTGFTDIIEGKGGGTIFLLHGKPGWGKTASAEAVAEILHKPLYSVSVGELGTSTEVLELKLRQILDVAVIWDAVLLLDEADIFLEERDEHNIHRNAMVGVFLRLLEYHNGVLFLTTNRVKKIDPAFYSRISVALHYKSEGKALKVWQNLLKAAGLDPSWAFDLFEYDVNGRQIKNAIRMAMTLAKSKDRDVNVDDLKRACQATLKFEAEMKIEHDGTPKRKRKSKVSAAVSAASNGV
jgi:hypothetical protein